MSVQLLDKTRKINKLLHNNNSSKVVFNDICKVMTDILKSNILVISKKGKYSERAAVAEFRRFRNLL
ncbi:GTP-sensing transcriptional pleiotropic repressor CodY [Eubacterium plexicaudatum ASF492]|uniref:Transcriptional pleiotropic repressor n=1 Tax=Eubacterium plexicaudatum ASF492 TaxID=1235802 RepID=N2BBD2_9FIRM|nr:GTP-sensing transcriptional pleiotropic repressor CodY [Eubacterium plexicaudatum ASF492]